MENPRRDRGVGAAGGAPRKAVRRALAGWFIAGALVATAGHPAPAADDAAALDSDGGAAFAVRPEMSLVEALVEVQKGQLDAALRQLSSLIRRQPDFRLAHLIYGDLLTARTDRLPGFGPPGPADKIQGLRDEARARLLRYAARIPDSHLPAELLVPRSDATSTLVVDLGGNRLHVFVTAPGKAVVEIADFYVSIGVGGPFKQVEGDDRTPVGVYSISSFLPGDQLPDLYGAGALVLDYPNGWDRHHGRTGSGIWIHGTESGTYSRAPRSSKGCVTLSNEDFSTLLAKVDVGRTPVILTPSMTWRDGGEVAAERRQILDVVEGWRRAWQARDTERYLDYYSPSFTAPGMSYAAWLDHKRRVNAAKSFIRVELDDVEVYRYPDEDDLVRVSFVQDYRSDTFRSKTQKDQFWRREDGGWRIVYESRR